MGRLATIRGTRCLGTSRVHDMLVARSAISCTGPVGQRDAAELFGAASASGDLGKGMPRTVRPVVLQPGPATAVLGEDGYWYTISGVWTIRWGMLTGRRWLGFNAPTRELTRSLRVFVTRNHMRAVAGPTYAMAGIWRPGSRGCAPPIRNPDARPRWGHY